MHELQLEEGDTFYLFTDGYADTFSGERKSKKLTTKRFRQILLEIREQPLQEQEAALHQFLEEWKDGIEQIDDILVIGVRL
jgi:serine phosphatase RsbU (regulator of sigma subunit)